MIGTYYHYCLESQKIYIRFYTFSLYFRSRTTLQSSCSNFVMSFIVSISCSILGDAFHFSQFPTVWKCTLMRSANCFCVSFFDFLQIRICSMRDLAFEVLIIMLLLLSDTISWYYFDSILIILVFKKKIIWQQASFRCTSLLSLSSHRGHFAHQCEAELLRAMSAMYYSVRIVIRFF